MDDKVEIRLAGAADEPDPKWQAELREFKLGLLRLGVSYHQCVMTFDSVDVAGYPLPVFLAAVAPYAHDAITGVVTLIEAWIKARIGRKVRIKYGEFDVDRVQDLGKVAAFLADQRRQRKR